MQSLVIHSLKIIKQRLHNTHPGIKCIATQCLHVILINEENNASCLFNLRDINNNMK